jgi:hypothetical protein
MTDKNHMEKSQTNKDNTACIFCKNLLCNLESEEGWIKCLKCNIWARKECAEVGEDKQKCVCDSR